MECHICLREAITECPVCGLPVCDEHLHRFATGEEHLLDNPDSAPQSDCCEVCFHSESPPGSTKWQETKAYQRKTEVLEYLMDKSKKLGENLSNEEGEQLLKLLIGTMYEYIRFTSTAPTKDRLAKSGWIFRPSFHACTLAVSILRLLKTISRTTSHGYLLTLFPAWPDPPEMPEIVTTFAEGIARHYNKSTEEIEAELTEAAEKANRGLDFIE